MSNEGEYEEGEYEERDDYEVISGFLRRCSTLAETRFALALLEGTTFVADTDEEDGIALSVWHGPEAEETQSDVEARCQVCVLAGTRSDFLLTVLYGNFKRHVVVEIDDPSHWKDDTKAAEDRARDLAILGLGIPTVRLTNAQAMQLDRAGAARILTAARATFRVEEVWRVGAEAGERRVLSGTEAPPDDAQAGACPEAAE